MSRNVIDKDFCIESIVNERTLIVAWRTQIPCPDGALIEGFFPPLSPWVTHTLASCDPWLIESHSVKSISWLIWVNCAISRNQSNPIKQLEVICPNGLTCVLTMTHNYESCAKYINHMTTNMSHVKSQPITINQGHAIALSCENLWVNWSHSVKDNKLITKNY